LRSNLPVLRTKRRYMSFLLESETDLMPKDLLAEIYSAQISLMGDLGAASNKLKLICFDGCFGILRCNHDRIQDTRALLATISMVDGTRASVQVIGVSGTIKSATKKYLPRLNEIKTENHGRRIELDEVSGCIIGIHGYEIDLCPDDQRKIKGSDTRYLGLTSFDLCGGLDDADGTSNGLRQGDNGI
jgi:ribonuclease P/MRP protein subunit POP5